MRLAHNLDNDRIYFLGGDYGGPNAMSSARNELYSYSIAANNWTLEYPYCGAAGEMQPDHPDEVGWAYDNRRKLFWLLPGFLWNGHQNKCPEGVKLIPDVLQFDPATRKWARPPEIRPAPTGSAERGKFAVYDPKTDRLIQFHRDGGQGSLADILDIQSGRWKTVSLSHDSRTRQYLNNAHLDKEYMAADFENRHVYVIDPIGQRLLRFHLDGLNITSMGALPAQTGVDFTIPVWDSVNKVLLWPRLPNLDGHVTLYIFHPDTNSWEKDSMRQPEGLAVRGNSAVFDPSQNVLLLIGGLKSGDTDPSLQHFFLYRYGNGRGDAAGNP
jgi:hypothetical protein